MNQIRTRHTILAVAFALNAVLFFSLLDADAKSRKRDKPSASKERLQATVKYLSSDELEGRGVGTAGLDKAADYIAQKFAEYGLRTDVVNGKPFQPFTLAAETKLGSEENNHLTLYSEGDEGTELALDLQFRPVRLSSTGTFDAPLVFVGYGITAPDYGYDDYAGIDVKGKVVIIIRREPQQQNPDSVFDGTRSSRHATYVSKIENAIQHEAAAVIMVNDHARADEYLGNARHGLGQYVGQLKTLSDDFSELEEPDAEAIRTHQQKLAQISEQIQEFSEAANGNGDHIIGFNEAGGTLRSKTIPVFFCQRGVVDPLITECLGRDLKTIELEIDDDLKTQSALLSGAFAKGSTEIETTQANVKNVIGVLEGTGDLADETIIVGAHYDHLGYGGQGSLAPWTNDIHNGADDNASGTAAMLETAFQIANRKEASRRRIVFMAFSAEERGLIGSARYAKEPIFALDNTVAMINYDMVGRMSDNKLIITGTGTSTLWPQMLDGLREEFPFEITRKPEGTGPSDHQTFYLQDIPVLHIFTGLHDKYHRPSDDYDTINFDDMDRITNMVVKIVDQVDKLATRPDFKKAEPKQNVQNTGGTRPYFGSIPDFADDVEGLPLSGVTAGGPAAKGGIQKGDIITGLGEFTIDSIEDFDSALRRFKAGQKVKVTVQRGKEKLELEITLGEPR